MRAKIVIVGSNQWVKNHHFWFNYLTILVYTKTIIHLMQCRWLVVSGDLPRDWIKLGHFLVVSRCCGSVRLPSKWRYAKDWKDKEQFPDQQWFPEHLPQKIPYRISTQHPDPVNCASSKGCLTCVPMNSVEISWNSEIWIEIPWNFLTVDVNLHFSRLMVKKYLFRPLTLKIKGRSTFDVQTLVEG